jgi:hypothetical protein
MRRRAHLLTTATLVTALAPIVAVSIPSSGLVDSAHGIRDSLIEASTYFYDLPDILTGSLNYPVLAL